MIYVVAVVALLPFMALAVGAATGHASARACCSVEASRDLRMRAAFDDADVDGSAAPVGDEGAEPHPRV